MNQQTINLDEMTPRRIVEELDRFIIGQVEAKRAVAIAMRNRIRRRLLPELLRDEVMPKNIIMIGPTGCGKTEIARRLSKMSGAPFVKVEATKYTEVGYVGRDVESMVRDLVANALLLVKKEFREKIEESAQLAVEDRLLDLMFPGREATSRESRTESSSNMHGSVSTTGAFILKGMQDDDKESDRASAEEERRKNAREIFRKKLRSKEMEEREVEIEVKAQASPMVQVLSGQNSEDIDLQMQNILGDLMPKRTKRKKVTIAEARKIILEEEIERLLDHDRIQNEAIRRSEQLGIIFIDEIDKISGRSQNGPDVSREGVQRDLLPIVEGATIHTKSGPVKTDHILFIAAGAFHSSKPSDLIPEFQGRFPIRVELEKLTQDDFRHILTGPENSLIHQYQELLLTEGVTLNFQDDALDELALIAYHVNESTENIGARRLHTILERLLEDISFNASDLSDEQKHITITKSFVQERLTSIVENRDLSRYIL